MRVGGGAFLEELEKRRDSALVDDDLLVPVVVEGEGGELVGGVDPGLDLAHLNGGDEGPDPGHDRIVAGDGREGEIGSVGVEDGEEPLHVADGGLKKVRDLAKISGRGDGEDLAEDAAVLALADESEGAVEVLHDVGDDSADGALVDGGGGGGYPNRGAEHLGEAVNLLGELGAVLLGGLGLLGGLDDAVGEEDRERELLLQGLLLVNARHCCTEKVCFTFLQ